MKIDINNKNSRFTQRTLAAFSQALFQLLEKKAFEEITVNELCEISNYPRSTFYNYFEDIYDLLEYTWTTVSADIVNEKYIELDDSKYTQFLFRKMYDANVNIKM